MWGQSLVYEIHKRLNRSPKVGITMKAWPSRSDTQFICNWDGMTCDFNSVFVFLVNVAGLVRLHVGYIVCPRCRTKSENIIYVSIPKQKSCT